MGWTTFPVEQAGTALGTKIRDIYGFDNDRVVSRVIDSMVRIDEAYLAVHQAHKEDGASQIFAVVCQIQRDRGQIAVHDMTEFAGPLNTACPSRILRCLTDTDNPTALAWRGRCLEKQMKHDNPKDLFIGDTVQFDKPIRFTDGQVFTMLRYDGADAWRGVDAAGNAVTESVTIRDAYTQDWRLIGPDPFRNAETTWDFDDGHGIVAAHRHPNGGGLVADTAWVDPLAFVDREASVAGFVRIYGKVRLEDRSKARDNAVLEGRVRLADDAIAEQEAHLSGWSAALGRSIAQGRGVMRDRTVIDGMATLKDRGLMCDGSRLSGRACLQDDGRMSGQSQGTGRAVIRDAAQLRDSALATDSAVIKGMSVVGGTEKVTYNRMVDGAQQDIQAPPKAARRNSR